MILNFMIFIAFAYFIAIGYVMFENNHFIGGYYYYQFFTIHISSSII